MGSNPSEEGSNPILTVQIPNERFNPSKTGSKRGFGAKKPLQDGFQVNKIGFGGSEDEKRGLRIGFERSGYGF
jgi:hypothetical protein